MQKIKSKNRKMDEMKHRDEDMSFLFKTNLLLGR